MNADHLVRSEPLLPLSDAIVWAQPPYWDNFSSELLGQRVKITGKLEDLTSAEAEEGQERVIIALDDDDIQNRVLKAWTETSVQELTVVLPIPQIHVVSLKSMAYHTVLSFHLETFTRNGDLLAVKFVKGSQSGWDLHKLLEATLALSHVDRASDQLDDDLRSEIVDHLETLEQLIELTVGTETESPVPQSAELVQMKEQNSRLQSNNASLRLQVDTLERKYNALANSRLGRMTLRRWERK